MSSVKTTVKPYKLKPSGDSLTRDDLSTWQEVILSHMRQNDKWKDFLPGGQKSKWKAQDDSEVDDWTADVKAALADFTTCLATLPILLPALEKQSKGNPFLSSG